MASKQVKIMCNWNTSGVEVNTQVLNNNACCFCTIPHVWFFFGNKPINIVVTNIVDCFVSLVIKDWQHNKGWQHHKGIYISYHTYAYIQYIPRNMHTVFALLCFVVVIHWLFFPYPSGLLHWHCGNLTIAPVPAKQPWWIWINTSCEFIMNDCITTTKQSTTKPCAFFLGYTVCHLSILSPSCRFITLTAVAPFTNIV